MSRISSVVIRCLISLFHFCIGVTAAVYVIYTLVKWGTLEGCLPPMVMLYGGYFTMKSQLPDLCDCMFTSLIVAAFLNVAMCAFVNCMWKYKSNGFLLVNMLVSLAVAGFSVFVASMMTTYRMIWCDIIIQKLEKKVTPDCSHAATDYSQLVESRNITRNYERIEIQMLGLWSLVPLTVLLIFLYGIAMTLQRAAHVTNNNNTTTTTTTTTPSRSGSSRSLLSSPPPPAYHEVTSMPPSTPYTTPPPPITPSTSHYGAFGAPNGGFDAPDGAYEAPNPFDVSTPPGESTSLLVNHDAPPTDDSSA